MVNAEALFTRLQNKKFTHRELRDKVSELLCEVDVNLPAEIGTRELLAAAQERNWIHKTGADEYEIVVKQTKAA
jgi:hypothetical protein